MAKETLLEEMLAGKQSGGRLNDQKLFVLALLTKHIVDLGWDWPSSWYSKVKSSRVLLSFALRFHMSHPEDLQKFATKLCIFTERSHSRSKGPERPELLKCGRSDDCATNLLVQRVMSPNATITSSVHLYDNARSYVEAFIYGVLSLMILLLVILHTNLTQGYINHFNF
ncbi:hypothetical protein CEXT_39701 [Caerostris extrusa]|uniref:Uncharacterized protein n=1 Tax=Caerostris extrusa TaxID=172846 RepID=A0AAV4MG74_CAEEX|nr:hypothetical protein CEXT_39701 [Caerostris extrusa]